MYVRWERYQKNKTCSIASKEQKNEYTHTHTDRAKIQLRVQINKTFATDRAYNAQAKCIYKTSARNGRKKKL